MPIWGQVELLCRAVMEEGRKQAESILSKARAEAERTLKEARETVEIDLENELVSRRGAAHAKARRIVDSAELEPKRRIMVFREQIVREVFDALVERTKGFRIDPSYGDFLMSALREGIEHLSGSVFVAELSPEDLELVRERAGNWAREQGVTLDLKPALSIAGGVRVYSGDGRMLYDNSLSARLKRREDDIRQEIWRGLFGTEGKPA